MNPEREIVAHGRRREPRSRKLGCGCNGQIVDGKKEYALLFVAHLKGIDEGGVN